MLTPEELIEVRDRLQAMTPEEHRAYLRKAMEGVAKRAVEKTERMFEEHEAMEDLADRTAGFRPNLGTIHQALGLESPEQPAKPDLPSPETPPADPPASR